MATIKRHWPIAVILVIFLGLGIAYSVITPLFESPDEVWHYEYVRWLVEGRRLPTPEDVGTAPWHQEGSQPPLYYLAAALLTSGITTDNAAEAIRYNPHAAIGQADTPGNKNAMVHGRFDAWPRQGSPWEGVILAAHVARLFSLLLGAVTVLSAYGIALVLFPGNKAVAVLAASLVAFNPQFLFINSSVTNVSLVTAACSAGVWMSISLVDKYARPKKGSAPSPASRGATRASYFSGPTVPELLLLGLLAGIAALAQLSGLALAGLAVLTLLVIAWRQRASLGNLVLWLVVIGTPVLVVAGWWYIRNLLLYGDPSGLQAMYEVLPARGAPPTWSELGSRAEGVWRSMWAVFGWFNIVVPDWLYALYGGLSAIALGGLVFAWPVRRLVQRRRDEAGPRSRGSSFFLQVVLLVIWIVVILLGLVAWAQKRYPQGRLLFPALAAASVLLAFGLTNWFPSKLHRAVSLGVAAGLCALAVIVPFAWIAPAYVAPALLPSGVELPHSASVGFGDQLRLVGFELEQAQVEPGGSLPLTLYWQATQLPVHDYSIFVHLVDEIGILQAQHDSYPAGGALPTSEWPLAATIPDRHVIHLPSTAIGSSRLSIVVGAYDYATGQRLAVNGRDSQVIGEVEVKPRMSAEGIPNPVEINFDNQIALVGFDIDRQTLRPGEAIRLSLWWKALAAPKEDYVVFAHLVYPPDAVWAGSDQAPQGGAAPTSHWQRGQQVNDTVQLKLPAEAPPGTYFIEVGLYDPKTMERLKVDGSDKGILLGYVKVG